MLAVSHLSKRFGPVQALDDVTLDFPGGSVTALLGENGAGKSTLVRIIDGEHLPDTGQVLLDGSVLGLHSPADARKAGIRIIPQEPEIVPHVSVAENVYIGALSRGFRFDRAALRLRVREDLARIGFERTLDPDTLGRDLTPAQRQLVEILRALTTEAKVIAFDEPTSSISEHEVEALFDLIRRLRSHGLAIIYVSHRLAEIFQIADRVAVLRDGKLVGVKPAEGLGEREVVSMMVGRDLSAMFARERQPRAEVVLSVEGLTSDEVSNVDLTIHAGEVVALAGLVGAGRSELCRALAGDLAIRAGTVKVDGRVVRLKHPWDAIRAGIVYAPEERKAQALLLGRSVRENITLAVLERLRRLRFVLGGAERSLAQDYQRKLNVRTPSIEQPVGRLSGGNQQKVVLARWLARHPRVLMLDEPTRGIDVGAKAEIYHIIADLARAGMAVLVVSSELPEVLGLADRIAVMQNGRITGWLEHGQADEEAIVRLAMIDDLNGGTA